MANVLHTPTVLPEAQSHSRFLVCLRATALLAILAVVTGVPCGTAGKLPSTSVAAAIGLDHPRIASSRAFKQHQSEGEPQEQNPASPARPSPPEAAVTKPLEVTYENGQLTIIAEDAPLADVMRALRRALGADIELPSAGNSERIWVHLGPGPAHRVLRDLLDGTEFNYVIQASEESEDGVRSVLLTPRAKAGEPAGSPAAAQRAANPRIPSGTSNEMPESENPAAADSVSSADAASPHPPVGSMNQQLALVNQQNAAAHLGTETPQLGTPGSEQMIQQLQSMYQQRRQIQIQQNQKAQAPPNQ